MKKLMLEALAAWLALAMASGQACASVQTGANSVLMMVTNPEASLDEVTTPYSDGNAPANGGTRTNAHVALLTSAAAARKGTRTRLTAGVQAPAGSPFRVDAAQSNATLGFSPSSAGDFTPGRKNDYGTELKRRGGLHQHDGVGASPGGLVAANSGRGPSQGHPSRTERGLDAGKIF